MSYLHLLRKVHVARHMLKHEEMSRVIFRGCWNLHSKNCHQTRSQSSSTFKADDLHVKLTSKKQTKPRDATMLQFGSVFTDHILRVEWSRDSGWGSPVIEPMEDLRIHPAAKVLHYSTTVFEGMKAFRGVDDKIRFFRPELNVRRFLSSAERAYLPAFDGTELLKCLNMYVSVERDWVPAAQTDMPCSLYIRPTFIATESSLGVSASNTALLYTILSPVGPYYPTGMKPVSLLADPKYVRSWPGGSGAYKMGANYAPTITIQEEAVRMGCQQALWLLGDDHRVTEVGSMNLFMLWTNENGEEELITAPLDGTVLPGVTRNSLLALAREWGEFKVSERDFTMKMVTSALKENRVKEMFGAGTACVVCPIERILYQQADLPIPTMQQGAPVTMKFYRHLLDIQYGRIQYKDWTVVVD